MNPEQPNRHPPPPIPGLRSAAGIPDHQLSRQAARLDAPDQLLDPGRRDLQDPVIELQIRDPHSARAPRHSPPAAPPG